MNLASKIICLAALGVFVSIGLFAPQTVSEAAGAADMIIVDSDVSDPELNCDTTLAAISQLDTLETDAEPSI